jgi:hypothetical protein
VGAAQVSIFTPAVQEALERYVSGQYANTAPVPEVAKALLQIGEALDRLQRTSETPSQGSV